MSYLPKIDSQPRRRIRKRRAPASAVDTSQVNHLQKMFTEDLHTPSKEHPRLDFFQTYKNIDKITQGITQSKAKSNPKIAFLSCCDKEKLQPKPLGLLSTKPKSHVQVRQSLSERYVKAYSAALKQINSLEKIDLWGNNLKEKSTVTILDNISRGSLTHMNLSYNQLGPQAIERIRTLCKQKASNIKTLNLESCGLKDSEIQVLCKGLKRSITIKTLNLAKNILGDRTGTALGKLLKKHLSLKNLDLHWNSISQQGAADLFRGLALNNCLQQLDLSWNSLGTSPELMLQEFTDMLETNTKLRHLDISYNSLSFDTCTIIAEALKSNHTILGIHTTGNSCYIDSLGFMIPSHTAKMSLSPSSHKRILSVGKDKERPKTGDNCWVCEKWAEVTITYPALVYKSEPMFSHLEIDDFQPVHMEYKNDKFKYKRVLPEVKTKGFFSDIKGTVMVLPNRSQVECKSPMAIQAKYSDQVTMNLEIKRMNILNPTGNICEIDYPFKTQPRMPLPVYVHEIEVRPKTPWDISRSIFKDYVRDTPALLNKCFEFDWKHAKISNFLFRDFEDQEVCKQLLRDSYAIIKNTYTIYSMVSSSEIFSVSSNTMFDFFSQAKALNSSYVSSGFGVNWNTIKSSKIKGQVYNPGNSMVRYEFMEMIVRVAADKYYNSGQVNKVSQAINLLLNDLRPYMEACDYHAWRESYFCEEMDYFYRTNENLMRLIYVKFSKRKVLPGQKPFMCLEEFREICNEIGVVVDSSTTRIVDQAFTSAIMTQEDELYRKRHMEMNLIEFYEAITRVCDSVPGNSLYEKMQTVLPDLMKLANKNALIWRKKTINSFNRINKF